jgi:2-aminobenzoate-CoA ligase
VACSAPLAFTYGLGMLVVFPLRAGACALLTETMLPPDLVAVVADEGVTVLATAPTAYKAILRSGLSRELAGLRVGVSAGEHLPAGIWERLRDTIGLLVIDGIGATELLHIFIAAAGDDIRPGATGRPVPAGGRRSWVLTARSSVLACPAVWVSSARSAVVISMTSGSSDMWSTAGTLLGTSSTATATGVARPDSERGSVVSAFVVLRPGVADDAAMAASIQEHVKQLLAPYQYPRDVRFRPSLPRNTNGKLQYFALRAEFASSHDQSRG